MVILVVAILKTIPRGVARPIPEAVNWIHSGEAAFLPRPLKDLLQVG